MLSATEVVVKLFGIRPEVTVIGSAAEEIVQLTDAANATLHKLMVRLPKTHIV